MKRTEIIRAITDSFSRHVGEENILTLILGGSLARGNLVPGWSDADLLLVPKSLDIDTLRAIKAAESEAHALTGLDIDTMIAAPEDLHFTDASAVQDKVRNFFFLLHEAKVLLNNGVPLKRIKFADFKQGVEVLIAEQQKKFLRRNADARWDDEASIRSLFRKNIKIVFLVLRRAVASRASHPTRYEDIIRAVEKRMPSFDTRRLRRYAKYRRTNGIERLSIEELRNEIGESVVLFRSAVLEIVTHKKYWH